MGVDDKNMSLPKPCYEEPGITIYCGDCRAILPHLPQFDLCIADPPYGLGESNVKKHASRCGMGGRLVRATHYEDAAWDNEPASVEEIQLTIQSAKKVIIWGGNYFTLPAARCWLVWDKEMTGDFADGEMAWTNLQSAVRIFRFCWNGMIRAGEGRGVKRVHPTQKPVELMSWCIERARLPEDGTIIDPFMGSGTTLVAAKLRGRRAVGIEISEKYCEIAVNRLRQGVLITA